MKPRNRILVLSALAVAAIACHDAAAPSELAATRGNTPNTSDQLPRGDLSIRGVVLRYSGRSDSSSDTLGTLVAEANAQVEAYYLGPITDTVPRDTVPRDSIPDDTVRADSSIHGDTMSFLRLARAIAASAADSGGNGGNGGGSAPPRKAAQGRTNEFGFFNLDRLGKGVYRVDVTPQGSNVVRASAWVALRDSAFVRFTLPRR